MQFNLFCCLLAVALILLSTEGRGASKKQKCLYIKNGYCYVYMTSGELWQCKGLRGFYDPANLHYSVRVTFQQHRKEGKCRRVR
jgi:hypothetical protein